METNNLDGTTATPAETQVAPATTEQDDLQTNVTPEGTPEETTQTPVIKEPEPEKDPKMLRELKEQRRKRQEAEKENLKKEAQLAYYKGLAEGKGYKPTTEIDVTQPPAPPNISDFESIDDYDRAKEEYLERKLEWKFVNRQKDEQARGEAEKKKQAQAQIDAEFSKRIQSAIDEDPELETVKDEIGYLITYEMGTAIKQSENAPDLIRYLHSNQQEIARIKALNPIAQIRELVKIENKILNPPQPKPKTITQAPEPISTVNASKGTIIEVDEDKMSTAEWIEKERQRRAEKFKRK